MSAVDFGDDLSHSDLSLSIIAKLLTAVQQQNLPIEDELIPDYITVSPLHDIHDVTVTAGSVDSETQETAVSLVELPYFMRVPESPYPYDLVHSTVGTGFSFPISGRKHAGRISCNGNTYIKVNHQSPRLNMNNDSFGVAFWIIKTSAGIYGIVTKRDIANTTNAGFEIWVDGNTINVRIADGINTILLSASLATLNDGNPHSVIVNVSSMGNLEIFIDNVSSGTIQRGSVGNLNNIRDVIIFGRDNADTIQNKLDGDIAWFVCKKTEIFDVQQRDDFHSNGLLDLTSSPSTEVITIPFMSNENPQPNCTPGLFSTGN